MNDHGVITDLQSYSIDGFLFTSISEEHMIVSQWYENKCLLSIKNLPYMLV